MSKYQEKFQPKKPFPQAAHQVQQQAAPTVPEPAPAPAQPPATPQQPAPTVVDPALEIAQGMPKAAEIVQEVLSKSAKGEGDDAPITRHPTKDYEIANNASRIGGKRQFQCDIFCRQLNCTFFSIEVAKPWGENPLGGSPIDIIFTREFPEKKILYDHFEQVPSEKLLNYKRDQAHNHGYRYLYQYPTEPLTVERLEKQLKLEQAFAQ